MNTKLAQRLGLTLAAACLILAVGCSDDSSTSLDDPISDAARSSALQKTSEVLLADRAMDSAQLVSDLTHGTTFGLAEETAGLDMELGTEMPQFAQSVDYTLGMRLASAARTTQRSELYPALHKSSDPGDVLYEETRTNLDGSVTTLRVIQDSPESVVMVEAVTDWPNEHLLLDQTRDAFVVDRGMDYESDTDDVLFSLRSELDFNNGSRLERYADERANGGIRDDARIDVTSLFTNRPGHPLLLSVESHFVFDVHSLADESDDRFVSVSRLSRFRGEAHDGGQPRVEESLSPEIPVAEGEEPCGGTGRRFIAFARWSNVEDWTDEASFACAGGGSLSRTINYADGSLAAVSVTENAAGIVNLRVDERDGSVSTGSFDPSAGSFSVQTTYPAGSDPVERSIDGESNADGSDWSLDEEIEYLDGFVERNHLEGRELADRKELSGSHAGRDETVEFDLASNLDGTQLEGTISNDRGESLEFAVELLPDLSRIIDFVAVNPTTRVEGHLEIGADGCGSGTLVVEEGGSRATVEIEFCHDEITDDAGNVVRL